MSIRSDLWIETLTPTARNTHGDRPILMRLGCGMNQGARLRSRFFWNRWRRGRCGGRGLSRTLLRHPFSEVNLRRTKGFAVLIMRVGDEDTSGAQLQGAESERDQAAALERADAGKEEGAERVTVRFIGYRVRPLDPDNFAGGCKDSLDALRHAHLIDGDEPWKIIFQTEQIRVKTFCEEKTEIIIEYPHD